MRMKVGTSQTTKCFYRKSYIVGCENESGFCKRGIISTTHHLTTGVPTSKSNLMMMGWTLVSV